MFALITLPRVTDFWGIVFPNYLGAASGILSAVVGLVAFLLSLQNRRGVKSIAGGLNAERATTITNASTPTTTLPRAGPAVAQDVVTWAIERAGRRYRLVNRSATHSAVLTNAQDVGGGGFRMLQSLPVTIEPGASIPFIIDRSIVGPTVTAVRLTWSEGDHGSASVTLYV